MQPKIMVIIGAITLLTLNGCGRSASKADVESKADDLRSEISDLDDKVDELKSQVDDLETAKDEDESRIDDLEAKTERLP